MAGLKLLYIEPQILLLLPQASTSHLTKALRGHLISSYMAKRFKLKFPRVSPLIQFCRPKHSSTVPLTYRQSQPVNTKALDISFPYLPAPPPSTPEYPPTKRHVSSKTKSIGCGSCRSNKSCTRHFSDCSFEIESSSDYELSMSPILVTEKYYYNKKKRNEEEKKKKKANPQFILPFIIGNNDWSFNSEGTEEDEESETPLYSSRSFSNEFSAVLESISEISDKHGSKKKKKTDNKNDNKTKKVRRLKSGASKNWKEDKSSSATGKIKTVFQPMKACRGAVKGKVRESVAVVKKSEDPYEDFKRSMVEMVMEKQIFEAKELEELLHCFLTLNSRHHQGVIVEAFSEIWEVLFSDPPVK